MSYSISLSWEIDQLVSIGMYPDRDSVIRSAMRSLYLKQPDIKLNMILMSYDSGDISLGKAAEMMGVSIEETKDIIRENGYQIHLGPSNIEELIEDISNA